MPVNASGTRKCFSCGSFDHLKDRCPRLNRQPAADMAGRSARVSRVNAMDDNRSAIGQTNATRGACSQRAANNFHASATRAACGQHATNDFHTSVVRSARGADSRRVASGRVFHASSTAARDHSDV